MTILLPPHQFGGPFFFFFSCLVAVARTSSTMLNRTGESRQPCLAPDRKGIGFSCFYTVNHTTSKPTYTCCSFHLCLLHSDRESLYPGTCLCQPPLLSRPLPPSCLSTTFRPSRSSGRKGSAPTAWPPGNQLPGKTSGEKQPGGRVNQS